MNRTSVGSFMSGQVCWLEGRVAGSVEVGADLSDCISIPVIKSHGSSVGLCAMLCGLGGVSEVLF